MLRTGFFIARGQGADLVPMARSVFAKSVAKAQHQLIPYQEISGSTLQISVARYTSWVRAFELRAKDALLLSGVERKEVESLGARHAKVLVSSCGAPGQLEHRDGTRPDCYVAAFYLPECEQPEAKFEPTRFSSLPPPSKSYALMTEDEAREMDRREWDVIKWSEEEWVKAGDIAVFREDKVHAGAPHLNDKWGKRIVFFLSLVPRTLSSSQHSDEEQLFEFNWAADCHGTDSKEFNECIERLEKRGHNPKAHLHE